MGELEVGLREGVPVVGVVVGVPVVGFFVGVPVVGFFVGDLDVGELEVGACEGEVVEVPVTHTHTVFMPVLHCPLPAKTQVAVVDCAYPAPPMSVESALVN